MAQTVPLVSYVKGILRRIVHSYGILLTFILFIQPLFSAELREIYSNSGGRIRTFDPIYADDLASRDLTGAVFDTLVEYDYITRPYKLKPSMLQKMPACSKDFTRYDFTLRNDLYFQSANSMKNIFTI